MNLLFSIQSDLPTDVAVSIVTMYTLVYLGYVEFDKNNDITSLQVNTTAPWSHTGPLDHNLEPDKHGLAE